MNIDILNRKGESTGRSQELPDEIYGIEPNEHVVYLAVKAYNASQRQGTHSTKERNAVVGSTRKIKRQKGTGTARAGDIKNPIFRGGGRVFGPQPRDHSIKLNKKVKRLARQSVIADKAQNERLIVLDNIEIDSPSTKEFNNFLVDMDLDAEKVLFIMGEKDENLYLSSRNLQNVKTVSGASFNVYQVLNADVVVVMEDAIEEMNSLLA